MKLNIFQLYCFLYWSDQFDLYTSNFQLGRKQLNKLS